MVIFILQLVKFLLYWSSLRNVMSLSSVPAADQSSGLAFLLQGSKVTVPLGRVTYMACERLVISASMKRQEDS